MKKKLGFFLLSIVMMCHVFPAISGGVTPLQLFFIAKKTFAEKSVAYVLIEKKHFKKNETAIKRASVQMQIKVKLFVIAGKGDVGNAFKKIEKKSLLILFDSELLTKSAIKLYVLSKCKDRNITMITSSKEYGESGALLSVFTDDDGKAKVQLNLQKNKDYKERFTEELIQSSGINEVLL